MDDIRFVPAKGSIAFPNDLVQSMSEGGKHRYKMSAYGVMACLGKTTLLDEYNTIRHTAHLYRRLWLQRWTPFSPEPLSGSFLAPSYSSDS